MLVGALHIFCKRVSGACYIAIYFHKNYSFLWEWWYKMTKRKVVFKKNKFMRLLIYFFDAPSYQFLMKWDVIHKYWSWSCHFILTENNLMMTAPGPTQYHTVQLQLFTSKSNLFQRILRMACFKQKLSNLDSITWTQQRSTSTFSAFFPSTFSTCLWNFNLCCECAAWWKYTDFGSF